MNTSRTIRLIGFVAAVLITATINGAMLWQFDAAAQEGVSANCGKTATALTQHKAAWFRGTHETMGDV